MLAYRLFNAGGEVADLSVVIWTTIIFVARMSQQYEDIMADDTAASRDIHLLTTDALLADLIGGRAVTLGNGEQLTLASDDARAVLDWYRRNRAKWQGNLSVGDTEAVIDTIGTPPPTILATADAAPASPTRVLRLVRVEAHRFAGLHAYGRVTEPPASFVFEPGKPITLLEGVNGSGKTSIANALVWCLTGQLIRSQRAPEDGTLDFACEIARDDHSVSTHPMSAITPMPQKSTELPPTGNLSRRTAGLRLPLPMATARLCPRSGAARPGHRAESSMRLRPTSTESIRSRGGSPQRCLHCCRFWR